MTAGAQNKEHSGQTAKNYTAKSIIANEKKAQPKSYK